jgi:hypothetical protein
MTFQRYCRRNAEIAQILSIPITHVSTDMIFGYEMGHLESGACSPVWLGYYLRDHEPVLTVAAYTTAPCLSAAGTYTLLSGTGRSGGNE